MCVCIKEHCELQSMGCKELGTAEATEHICVYTHTQYIHMY